MTAAKIDEAIECYMKERKKSERKAAETRFLSYAYLCGTSDTAAFMQRTRSLICYYIDFLSVLENPMRGPQAAWLALMMLIGAFGCYLLADGKMSIGLFIIAGMLVNGISLGRAVIAKWIQTSITIALYQEIIELIDRTLPGEC
ncbi:GSU0071 family protein [Geobacter sp. SVR]|uniref:GSU0071 family protein n=1 Tax=Geobacter sp. SVR TaxID=2495594 RepID=UPI00143F0112|nr:hypothetical protein [Geobacter sp. SVR]BCS53970.1 hypothetical protein GSVR_22780 [Geobacter sp. SVR]GCF86249.1 hypothetical protein GSbR_28490 [Geobacter sp. SVR]